MPMHRAWVKFNTRTQMMKGLFNYETAYRVYTQRCLEEFVGDNIQYAEVRPNFMKANQVWKDDGSTKLDNRQIMELIIEEYGKFEAGLKRHNDTHPPEERKYFGGLKVIYCTPRSFPRELVKGALKECLEFKKKWPRWIAGMFCSIYHYQISLVQTRVQTNSNRDNP